MLLMTDTPGSRLIIYRCLEILYSEDPVGTQGKGCLALGIFFKYNI